MDVYIIANDHVMYVCLVITQPDPRFAKILFIRKNT
jgi:hypothetical protein